MTGGRDGHVTQLTYWTCNRICNSEFVMYYLWQWNWNLCLLLLMIVMVIVLLFNGRRLYDLDDFDRFRWQMCGINGQIVDQQCLKPEIPIEISRMKPNSIDCTYIWPIWTSSIAVRTRSHHWTGSIRTGIRANRSILRGLARSTTGWSPHRTCRSNSTWLSDRCVSMWTCRAWWGFPGRVWSHSDPWTRRASGSCWKWPLFRSRRIRSMRSKSNGQLSKKRQQDHWNVPLWALTFLLKLLRMSKLSLRISLCVEYDDKSRKRMSVFDLHRYSRFLSSNEKLLIMTIVCNRNVTVISGWLQFTSTAALSP